MRTIEHISHEIKQLEKSLASLKREREDYWERRDLIDHLDSVSHTLEEGNEPSLDIACKLTEMLLELLDTPATEKIGGLYECGFSNGYGEGYLDGRANKPPKHSTGVALAIDARNKESK